MLAPDFHFEINGNSLKIKKVYILKNCQLKTKYNQQFSTVEVFTYLKIKIYMKNNHKDAIQTLKTLIFSLRIYLIQVLPETAS